MDNITAELVNKEQLKLPVLRRQYKVMRNNEVIHPGPLSLTKANWVAFYKETGECGAICQDILQSAETGLTT